MGYPKLASILKRLATAVDAPPDAVQAFKAEYMQKVSGAMHVSMFSVGEALGLWAILLTKKTFVTSLALAAEAEMSARYCAEWCLLMAAVGVLEFDSYDGPERRFRLKAELASAFADDSTLGLGQLMDPDRLISAFESGRGIAWASHHCWLRSGVRRFFAPLYEGPLLQNLPPEVADALASGGNLLDLGCGEGVSCCVLGAEFPKAKIDGIDFHAPSVAAAAVRISEKGLNNVKCTVGNADHKGSANYDVVTFFDCFHDMAVATAAAGAAFQHLKPGGVVLLVEPLAADEDSVSAQLAVPTCATYLAFSTHICLPCGMMNGGDALGTCCPTAKHRAIFLSMGFSSFESLASPLNALGFRVLLGKKAP
ncbi:S-adenosyl-L-methionine-dependent methyltransferase [Pelagophyceae sp. CCMP2097]|nr:S-adenosyl-L-methionine-dependent methyltransferase [Pelagophyceae sp. CCMP2097]